MNDLATIRRAYRYVVAYERRVLDAIAQIDEAVRASGFERNTPQRWWPIYTEFPSRDWAPDKQAWNNVPVFACRYGWLSGEENAAGTRYVLVDHVADTAFEQKRVARPSGELDPLEDLGDPESSKSVLRWLVIEFLEPLPPRVWKLYWAERLSSQLGAPGTELILGVPTQVPMSRQGGSLRLTTACVDLETIGSPAALKELVIEPLQRALAAKA